MRVMAAFGLRVGSRAGKTRQGPWRAC
jgi:hypothetical protein